VCPEAGAKARERAPRAGFLFSYARMLAAWLPFHGRPRHLGIGGGNLAMADRIPMTRMGYAKLEDELKRLKTDDRFRIVKEIEVARAHGDISENAEFHAAKERQSHIEGRIRVLEDKLARAQVIDASGQSPDAVRFGATVVLLDVETEEHVTYTLVGEDESDVSIGLISIGSPVARALLGKAVESTVTVRVPRGTREFEIVEIRFEL
jgi:transcription elongation factor GreA